MKDDEIIEINIYKSNKDINKFDYDSKVEFTEKFRNFQRKNRHINRPGFDNFNLTSEVKFVFGLVNKSS